MSELEIIEAMEASLVLENIGKSGKARKIFNSYGANGPDHDDFHREGIRSWSVIPAIALHLIS